MRRNWKSVQPNSLIEALRLCKDYAAERHQLSVARLAALMGTTEDLLYKWLANGRMPALLIPTYEHVCRCNFATRWLAAAGGHLMIAIPTGRAASGEDMNALQVNLNAAVGALLRFYAAGADGNADETLASLRTALEGLAYQHHNVQQSDQPQLELGEPA